MSKEHRLLLRKLSPGQIPSPRFARQRLLLLQWLCRCRHRRPLSRLDNAFLFQLVVVLPYFRLHPMRPNENKMSDDGRDRASLGVKVWKSSQKWSVRRSAVRSIAWLGLCGFIGGGGATIRAQLHNKFFAIIAIAHILSCKLESAFL